MVLISIAVRFRDMTSAWICWRETKEKQKEGE
jgi:hypothetical protein